MMIRNGRQVRQLIPCRPALIVILCLWAFLWTGAVAAYENAECIACHATNDGQSSLTMDLAAFETSVHSDQAECIDCHTQIIDDSHMQLQGSGAVDCSQCHDTVNAHGTKGPAEARPDCADCHSRHGILASTDPESTVYPDNLEITCSRCHEAESGRTDYLSWLPSVQIRSHPKQDFAGTYSKDNCIGCHQGQAVHGEAEVIDETAQCSRCHIDNEGQSALMGVMHARADLAAQPGTWVAGIIYQLFLLALLGFGGAYMVGRFSRRSRGRQTGGD